MLTPESNNSTQLLTCWVLNRISRMRDLGLFHPSFVKAPS